VESYLDERERWEALLGWLRENGLSILAGVALAAVAFGGYRWWQGHRDQRDLNASALYAQMENAFGRGDEVSAFAAAGELERTYGSTPYADQARLASAGVFVQDGELGRAAGELRVVMLHPHDPILGLIARLRLARVQIAQHRAKEALATLDAVKPGAFATRYDVVRGDAYYALGERAAALAQYRLARATDPGGETDKHLLSLEISDLAANPSQISSAAKPLPPPAGK
jgi:predicted negative regulator of RcsB-dependent stress response